MRSPIAALLLAASPGAPALASELRLDAPRPPAMVRPLQRITAEPAVPGTVVVTDGAGREYARVPATAGAGASFLAGGAAGTHAVRSLDAAGRVVASASFVLEPRTAVEDEGGRMRELLRLARKTLERPNESGTPTGVGALAWGGRTYHYYVPWIRDHVHTMKGMKHFDGRGWSFLDFFRETQKENGMIWDFFATGEHPSFYETAYGPLGYARRYGEVEMVRMPAEADVEYLFVEGVYYAWKSNADDGWMARQLDAAVRAMDYSFGDRARFSTKYGLVKRGYTIDTWDFQVDDATTTSIFPRWGTLLVDPDRSRFGVMFGDNTGYAAACRYLAEMLERASRPGEAARFRERERQVRDRLDRLAWLGTHFRHWVPEDETVVRDLGVDEKAQVSLSNTYSLNRGITHEQAAAVVRTYQRLRASLPPGSPGEWYAIYPPFGKGFTAHAAPWQYVNGGVSPIFAGELARGAFEHGFESYAADVLSRVLALSRSSGEQIRFAYTGAYPPAPAPRFTPVDLAGLANMDLGGKGAPGVPSWMAAMPDDHLGNLPTGRQTFAGVPFVVADPAVNGRRGAVAVSRRKGFAERVSIPIGAPAASFYLLHSVGNAGNLRVAGSVTFVYEDGTDATQYVVQDRNVSGWWYPSLEGSWPGGYGSPRNPPLVKLAWRGRSDVCPNVGLYWYGLDNPHPQKRVRSLDLGATRDGAIYAVAGLTTADQPLHQPPPAASFGGPDNWAAGAIVYALLEGLAGVVDHDVAYRTAAVAPRWLAAGTNVARVVVHYPASDGYVAYDYRHDPVKREITMAVTGSGEEARCHVLLPEGARAATAVVDGAGTALQFATSRLESSAYADFTLALPQPREVAIRY